MEIILLSELNFKSPDLQRHPRETTLKPQIESTESRCKNVHQTRPGRTWKWRSEESHSGLAAPSGDLKTATVALLLRATDRGRAPRATSLVLGGFRTLGQVSAPAEMSQLPLGTPTGKPPDREVDASDLPWCHLKLNFFVFIPCWPTKHLIMIWLSMQVWPQEESMSPLFPHWNSRPWNGSRNSSLLILNQ